MKIPNRKYALISIASMMIVLSCSPQVESELSNKNNQLELGIKECIRDFNQKQDSKFPPPPPAPTLCDCIQGVIDENNK